jgi:hypothetical protein
MKEKRMPTKKLEIQPRPKARKPVAKKPTDPSTKPVDPPSHEQIASLAEKYWVARGHPLGSPEEDWLRAERELLGKAS